MKKNRGYSGSVSAIQSIAKFRDISTVKPIITYGLSLNIFNPHISESLEYISGVHINKKYGSGNDVTIVEFPDLGTLDISQVNKVVWEYWWEHRDEYAKKRFERYYPDWEYAIKHEPENEARKNAAISNMLQGGIAALPFLMDAIEKGDESLIPIAAGMTKQYKPNNYRASGKSKPLSEKATIRETTKWWNENKDDWTLKDAD